MQIRQRSPRVDIPTNDTTRSRRWRRLAAAITASVAAFLFAAPGSLAELKEPRSSEVASTFFSSPREIAWPTGPKTRRDKNQVKWGASREGTAIKAYVRSYRILRRDDLNPGRTIAAFAYTRKDGAIRYVVAANIRNKGGDTVVMEFDENYKRLGSELRTESHEVHAEVILDKWLRDNKIETNRVYGAEVERETCNKCAPIFNQQGEYLSLRKNGGIRYNYPLNNVREEILQARNGFLNDPEEQSLGATPVSSTDKGTVFAPTESKAEASRQINNTMQQAAGNMGLDCSEEGAVGGLGSDARRIRSQVVAMAALPLATRCGKETTNGLAKALESNDYGGVDFSTLEMRYMSDDPGSGVQYSFSARPASAGLQQDMKSGLDALTNSTADLRTWLVLNPSKFWVNLNPAEPNRIIDPVLGQTNAGRTLLEADLQMKRTQAKLLDPKTKFGAQYWKELTGNSDTSCYSSRMWITPGDIQVYQDDSSLYILNASLAVKAKAEHIRGSSKPSCTSDPAADARNERLEQAMVVPKIAEAVNTAPEYAPLRRAFLARIVAQWIRTRHQSGHRTSFDDLLESGNVGPAKHQDDWRPQQVFDTYVHSIRDGEFTYEQTIRQGRKTFISTRVVGGVDFSNLRMNPVSAAQMNQQHPKLPQTVQASLDRPASAADGSIWLGETASSPSISLWTRTTDTLGSLLNGRVGTLIVILIALGAVTFGFPNASRRRRQPAN